MNKLLVSLALFAGIFTVTSNISADDNNANNADQYKNLEKTGNNPWDPRKSSAFDRDASSDQNNPEDRANSLEGEGKESSTEE